jgi:hypothetical protein
MSQQAINSRPALARTRRIQLCPPTPAEMYSRLSETARLYYDWNIQRRLDSMRDDREYKAQVERNLERGRRATGQYPPIPFTPPRCISQPLPAVRQPSQPIPFRYRDSLPLPVVKQPSQPLSHPPVQSQHLHRDISMEQTMLDFPVIPPSRQPDLEDETPRRSDTGKFNIKMFSLSRNIEEIITKDGRFPKQIKMNILDILRLVKEGTLRQNCFNGHIPIVEDKDLTEGNFEIEFITTDSQ